MQPAISLFSKFLKVMQDMLFILYGRTEEFDSQIDEILFIYSFSLILLLLS